MPDYIRQRESPGKTNTLFSTFQNKENPLLPNMPVPIRNPVLRDFNICFIPGYLQSRYPISALQTGFSFHERKLALTEFNRNVSGRQEFWRLNQSTQSKRDGEPK
ncbi:hypothetical protein CDAR_101931 [Caerostris darwini]|uniref:Uncharacterized protein n=1 Tax=Caerostris darwini TaxID=1538125 RepID=A0AAV4TFP9_9ARAC|nr:hypothetical protein CDAR_101931 [Caerostris darwini]